MIQAILIFLLLVLLAQFVLQPLGSLLQRILGFVFVASGVVFVIWPDLTTALAHVLGVGRGADLLMYLAVCAGSLVLYRLYLRLRQLELRDVEIVRELAILRLAALETPLAAPERPSNPAGSAAEIRRDPQGQPEALATAPSRFLNAVSGTAALLISILILRKAWNDVDTVFDATAYHLPFAALRSGLVSADSYRLSSWLSAVYHGFPVLVEFLQGWAWRLTGHLQAANLVGFAGLLVLAILFSRWFRIAATDFLVCSLAIPVILIGSTSMYDDLWVNSAATVPLMLTFGALIRPEDFTPGRLLAALAAFAIAANSKLQFIAVGTLSLAGLGAVLWIRRGRLNSLRQAWTRSKSPARAALLLACALLTATGYVNTVQNWITFRNPVYPVRVKAGPIDWPGTLATSANEPTYLSGTPQPVRWLFSVLEVNAFDGRNPLWTNSQGDVGPGSRALRMGGFFSAYVVLSLYWWVLLQRGTRGRFGYAPAVFFAAVTLVTACLPASQELRYYSYWMLTLTAMNLVLIASLDSDRARQLRSAVLATGGASLLFVVASSNGMYISVRGITPASIVHSLDTARRLNQMNLTPGEAVCVIGKNPNAFFYAPLFNPEVADRVHYRAVEGYAQQDCAGLRVVP